jgi:hypothetical protein
MKQAITSSFFMLSFLVINAQNTSQALHNKYLGTWISNDEFKKFILIIDKDSIKIESGDKIIHSFVHNNKANRFWIKYSNTTYSNVQSISSGLQEIKGNTLSDLRVQFRLTI